MLGLKPMELLLIFAIIFFLFGGKKLPALGASLGDAIRGFKRGISDADDRVTVPVPVPVKENRKA